MDVTPVAPQTWSSWVEVLTAMFASPNVLANLCREIATLRQSNEKHPGENVDQNALCISSLFTRLLAEAARTTPPSKFAQIFSWERLKFAVLKTGYYHRSDLNKYEKALLTRSHQREIELANMRQIIYMVSTLQICPRSCPRLLLLLKNSWKRASTAYMQPSPHW